MPELPEVETIVRELNASNLVGRTIVKAELLWEKSFARSSLKNLINQKIVKITRRGKFIIFHLTNGFLWVHLRMTGKFLFGATSWKPHHERLRLYFDDGRILHYEDQRKFGRWTFYEKMEGGKLGVEPFSEEYTLPLLKQLIKKHARQIKPFLLDQRFITGMGNIYVDEALWEAKIHPTRLTNTLNDKEIKALYEAIPKVLKKGIENLGTSLGAQRANYFSVSGRRGGNQYKLNVFRKDGDPCPRCGSIILKMRVAQRGTHYCPFCQK